jgi:hypothetical protein
VEYVDENSASVAKDALHNYKLDGEGKIKVRFLYAGVLFILIIILDHVCEEVELSCLCVCMHVAVYANCFEDVVTCMCTFSLSPNLFVSVLAVVCFGW